MTHANYILRPTYTPLPSKEAADVKKAPAATDGKDNGTAGAADKVAVDVPRAAVKSAGASSSAVRQPAPHPEAAPSVPTPSVLRAANEDDDLYDPYSDYHDGTLRDPHFERDPWS